MGGAGLAGDFGLAQAAGLEAWFLVRGAFAGELGHAVRAMAGGM